MASKKFEKGSDEFQFFAEFYKLVQDFFIPEDNDQYWEELIEASQKLSQKYQGKFYTAMILTFMNYVEEVIRDAKDKG